MNAGQYFNCSFSFRFCGVKFKVEIDESFSARHKSNAADFRGDDRPLHYHTKHELFCVFDSPLSVASENVNHEFRGCAVMIPPFMKHRSARIADYRLLFSYEIHRRTEFSKLLDRLTEEAKICKICDTPPTLSVYLEDLHEMLTGGATADSEAVECMLKALFYRLFPTGESKTEATTRKGSYLLTVERFINTKSTERNSAVSLELISEELNICKKQVSRIIKEHYGKPLFALVLEKKLTVACELLTETELSVAEIAERVNFNSENYFFKRFKEAYGVTPLKYRKDNRRSGI